MLRQDIEAQAEEIDLGNEWCDSFIFAESLTTSIRIMLEHAACPFISVEEVLKTFSLATRRSADKVLDDFAEVGIDVHSTPRFSVLGHALQLAGERPSDPNG